MDEYNLPIGGDIGPLINSLGQVKTGLQQVNEAAQTATKSIKEGFESTSKAVDNANKVIGQAATAYNTVNNSIAELTDALIYYKDLAFSEKDLSKLKEYNSQIQSIEKELSKLGDVGKKSYSDQTGQIERLNTALKLYKDFVTKATNTDQIAKYNAKIQETQNQLTKLGNAGKAGFDNLGNKIQQSQGYIERLTADAKEFQSQISKSTDPERIATLNKQLEVTQAEIARLNNAGRAGFDNLGNAIQSNTNLTGGLISGIKSVAASFGIFLGIQGLITLGKDLFNTANEIAGIDRAFTNLGRPDLLPKLRDQTRGFIADADLERLTIKANNFNIPLERLGTLLLFASQRAKDTGEDVDKLTENIIDGLGRKSSRIIDNLGISAVAVQKEFKKVGDFTTAVTNIIEREMGKAGVAVDTLADKTNRAKTSFKNIFDNFASLTVKAFSPELPDNTVIEKKIISITKGIGDFSKLTQDQRAKAIQQQTALIGSLSSRYQTEQKKLNDEDYFSLQAQQARVKSAGEELAARQAVVANLTRQNKASEEQARINKGLLSDSEKQLKVDELRGKVSNFIVGVTGTQAQKDAIRKQADDLQKEIDANNSKASAKEESAAEKAQKARIARAKKVADETLKINNQITEAQAQASDDQTKVEIAKEDARYKVAIDTLNKEKKDFPELQALINKAIEAENMAHTGRLSAIAKKQSDDQAKSLSDANKAVASVLKKDNEEQIDAVNQRYVDIREKTKKAGILTADLEKKLAEQQAKDVADVTLKLQQDAATKSENIAINNINARQKLAGETDKEYELKNQQAILGIKIEYAEKALKLIENNPEKAEQVSQIRAQIEQLKKELKTVGNSLNDEQGFSFSKFFQKALGVDDSTYKEVEKAAQAYVSLFNDVADSIIGSYQREIDAGQERIDALNDQLNTAQSYLDQQNDLKEKGYANDSAAAQKNVDAIKASLAQEQAARDENIKQQQAAQKVAAEIRAAEIAANTVEQVSNLATAAAKIFKAHAGIPFVGVVIALGAIAAMVAGFLAIKASIKAATTDTPSTTKYKKGGKLTGKSHEEGGNKYRSVDGNDPNMIELERDEFVINAISTAKHEKLIEAINKDDFSQIKLTDYPIRALLNGTGVGTHSEVARNIGRDTVAKQMQAAPPVVIVEQARDPHLPRIEKHLQKLVKYEEQKEDIKDMGDHLLIKRGNVTERQWKKN